MLFFAAPTIPLSLDLGVLQFNHQTALVDTKSKKASQKREFLEQLLEFDFRFRFERFYVSKPISKTLYQNKNMILIIPMIKAQQIH